MGPMRGLFILCQNPESFLYIIHFQLLIWVTCILVRQVPLLKQEWGESGSNFLVIGPLGVKMSYDKILKFCNVFYFQFLFLQTQPLVFLECLC